MLEAFLTAVAQSLLGSRAFLIAAGYYTVALWLLAQSGFSVGGAIAVASLPVAAIQLIARLRAPTPPPTAEEVRRFMSKRNVKR